MNVLEQVSTCAQEGFEGCLAVAAAQNVAVRSRAKGDEGVVPLAGFVERVVEEAVSRR